MALEQRASFHRKPTGRNAGVVKYDLLTALGSFACQGDKHLQRLVLRFITLIVARYNWQTNELICAQREIAGLWAVDERTVKRDLARLRDLGWLVVRRPSARGRVAVHGLEVQAILHATRASWSNVGPDFVQRLSQPQEPEAQTNVIPFPSTPELPAVDGLWGEALRDLHQTHPQLCAAWFVTLKATEVTAGVWELLAPSRFHASFVATHHLSLIEAALRRLDPSLETVTLQVEPLKS